MSHFDNGKPSPYLLYQSECLGRVFNKVTFTKGGRGLGNQEALGQYFGTSDSGYLVHLPRLEDSRGGVRGSR
jgi:hypothetical protein